MCDSDHKQKKGMQSFVKRIQKSSQMCSAGMFLEPASGWREKKRKKRLRKEEGNSCELVAAPPKEYIVIT
jgi:hypothetical protein